MDKAGVIPEENLHEPAEVQPKLPNESRPPKEPASSGSEDRLSVFEDFLSNLGLDDSSDSGEDDKPDDDQDKS